MMMMMMMMIWYYILKWYYINWCIYIYIDFRWSRQLICIAPRAIKPQKWESWGVRTTQTSPGGRGGQSDLDTVRKILHHCWIYDLLGGGFKYFLFSPLFGNDAIWLVFFKWVETAKQFASKHYLLLVLFQNRFNQGLLSLF